MRACAAQLFRRPRRAKVDTAEAKAVQCLHALRRIPALPSELQDSHFEVSRRANAEQASMLCSAVAALDVHACDGGAPRRDTKLCLRYG
jgi:hypothetical protein